MTDLLAFRMKRIAEQLPSNLFGGPVGNCYTTSEALYHLLGGKAAGWKPMFVYVNGGPHWFLKHQTGVIVDATAAQFGHDGEMPDYSKARGKGFLTRLPSRRARRLMATLVFSEEAHATR